MKLPFEDHILNILQMGVVVANSIAPVVIGQLSIFVVVENAEQPLSLIGVQVQAHLFHCLVKLVKGQVDLLVVGFAERLVAQLNIGILCVE